VDQVHVSFWREKTIMKGKLLNVLLVMAMLPAIFVALENKPSWADGPDDLDVVPVTEVTLVMPTGTVYGEIKGASEPAMYIIQFDDPPLAVYRGGLPGLAATNPAARGETRLDANSPTSLAYINYLTARQSRLIASIEDTLGHDVQVAFRYRYAYNGIAARMTPADAAIVAGMDGVRRVERDFMRYPDTSDTVPFIGATGIWNGTSTGGLPGTMGEGIVVGIIDTGINMDHPSFAGVGPVDGFTYTNPYTGYLGLCATHPLSYTCNDKLVGAYDFVDGLSENDGPEDGDGHGSHVASIVAGNFVQATMVFSTTTLTQTISGVAPHAHIISYDACAPDGCPGASLLAAIDQATKDGVDVINYSIGGRPASPWESAEAVAFLNSLEAGIFVAVSAGNDDPSAAAAVGSPANSPWVTSVGATTHDRRFLNALVNMEGVATPPADIYGESITSGYGPAPIVYAGDYSNPNDPTGDPAQCLEPYPAGTFHGEIVVCDRGGIARVEKGQNVLQGGAGGFVLANTAAESESIVADGHLLPAVHIGYNDAQSLGTWLAAAGVHTATISGTWTSYSPAYADIVADFSPRGPNADGTNVAGVIKPDVTAPGVSVLAASMDGIEYASMSGTSMASPHVAGSAALIMALHPDWTPAEVQSALMSTAQTAVRREDGVTSADPFDRGAGRVDLTRAGMAGFVLNETVANYLAADPDAGGDPTALNIASLGDEQCFQSCQWVRTLRSTQSASVDWTVSATGSPTVTVAVTPSTFTLAPGATQVITVEADVASAPSGEWVFGQLDFVPDRVWQTFAGTYVYSDTNVGAPEWNRPHTVGDGSSGSCAISSSGPVRYHSLRFGVDVSGTYTMTSIQDFDGYLHLYGGSFDPTDQCVGLLALNDDWTGAGNSRIVFALESGEEYYLITSGWGNGDEGNFTNTIEGPGNIVIPLDVTIPDAHFPIAVRPSSGILPSLVEINTRRNAGSQLVPDLVSIAITEMNLQVYGPVEGDVTIEMLSQDTANGSPFDDLNDGVFWFTYTVPANSMRLVANIVESEAPDLDLFVGRDLDGDGPEAAELVCSGTSSSWEEYCDVSTPAAGDWWILVQNWDGSSSQPDQVVLSSAVVPGNDNHLMAVTGPTSVPQKTPYDLRVYWNTPSMEAGDIWYGAFSIGTDATHPANVGTIPVNIVRHDDDVTKEVSQSSAVPGDTLVYTITIQHNVTPYTTTYYLADTIPDGMTYVPGSASATTGTVQVTGNALTWMGERPLHGYSYSFATSDTDPQCKAPMANSGAYLDLSRFGILPMPSLAGDSFWAHVVTQGDYDFFGQSQGRNVNLTADGFLFFDPSTPGATPGVHRPIPTAGAPNNLMAVFWRDLEVVYDAGNGSGVSMANLTMAGRPVAVVIEYDDVRDKGNPATSYDFEWIGYYEPGAGPGGYQYIFAYDNLSGTVTIGTIGLENYDASVSVPVAYNDISVTDGMAICFKQGEGPTPPVVITYRVTVDDGAWGGLENSVMHITDNPGDLVAETSAAVVVAYRQYLPATMRSY